MTTKTPDTTTSPETSSPIRASRRVTSTLRERIQSGFYGVGDWLPTERVLAEDMHVQRRVVRTAIDELVREGLISRQPNCRPVVAEAPAAGSATGGDDAKVSASGIASSQFVALIMWHGGGPMERAGTAQQRIFWGINQALGQAGYHAVFLDLGGAIGTEAENAEREAAHLRYAMEHGFGGVIFYPYAYRSNRELIYEASQRLPLVMLDRTINGVATDFVGVDNHQATYNATMHLFQQGHRRIAYVTKIEPIHPVQERIQGYIDAVRAVGISEIILPLPSTSTNTANDWQVVETMFGLPKDQRPTAVVCVNDYAAGSLAGYLLDSGLAIPEDVALTGFDDIVQLLPNGAGLTTMAQPYEEIGKSAVELLLRRLKDRSAAPATIELPAELIIRASSVTE
ncbi:MAG: GntR family transcriptional regulator [Capsulimonas sp.]|uniref:GntR family transcriptional regulator n=1 Tax=Capsulimonas sp. TaxID=2494211 RepID=UPI0032646397